ncbi:MAG: bifunctional phosphoribosylaminoimidazolecarboxamide formyltransferase/IMP cyclohydrolase [Planctomycetota bacterium]
MTTTPEHWAFLSVQDTTGVVDFARGLAACGYGIVATPGTRAFLETAHLPVRPLEEVTGFPLILGGLVKSMHPRILAGIQVDRTSPQALAECAAHGVIVFDIVAINFAGYETSRGRLVSGKGVQVAPLSIIRAAAGNYQQVLVVIHPRRYSEVLEAVRSPEGPSPAFRKNLAKEAWNLIVHYDIMVASAFEEEEETNLPFTLRREYRRGLKLRYGENPHQEAALYAKPHILWPCVANARILRGRAPSYNNILDADKGLTLALEFAASGAVIIKHALPVSAAIGAGIAEAVQKAFAAEYASRVGAAVACNGAVDADAAHAIAQPGRSIDLVIATDFTPEAVEIFETTKNLGEVRLLKAGTVQHPAGTGLRRYVTLHHVEGGVLAQTVDTGVYGPGGFHVVSDREPTDRELIDLEFACLVAKHTRSHSTVLSHGGATVAVASIHTSRVESVRVALDRAGYRAEGAVMASDSNLFLAEIAPLADAGIRAVIQTGGDTEEDRLVLETCNQRGIAMIVTRMRHFSHL